jgi:DNA-binding NtrC family response regulator
MLVKKHAPRILICDDDANIHLAIKSALRNDYDIRTAYHGDEALLILRKAEIDVVLLDLDMRTTGEGFEVLPKILELQSDIEVIVFSGRDDFESVRRARELGARGHVSKGCGAAELALVLKSALEHKTLSRKTTQFNREITANSDRNPLIGESPALQKIRKQVERARQSPAPLIITGETGTGKEVVARLLRKIETDGTLEPFVAVDSATIQGSVAESLLFGYEKGAFTGAEKTTRGLFEEADGGCIYFDELGNMPLEIQNKLLRVIQEKEVLRIGSARPIHLDFRVICATNRDLEAMVQEGKFKDDLYQRMNVLQIHIPPLRERKEDIPLLLQHFIKVHAHGLEPIHLLPETVEAIRNYPFPGNVRELSNLILYLYSMCEERMIAPIDLPPRFLAPRTSPASVHPAASNNPAASTDNATSAAAEGSANAFFDGAVKIDLNLPFYEAVEGFERSYLMQAYHRMEGNISRMSTDLRMDRSYLHRKLKNYGIHGSKLN